MFSGTADVPKGNVRCWSSMFEHPNSSHKRIVLGHGFNRSLTVVVSRRSVAAAVQSSLERACFYRGEGEPSKVVREQGMACMSQGPLEAGRWSKTEHGHVVIGLPKEAHERLGLPGQGIDGLWLTQLKSAEVAKPASLIENLPRTMCIGCSEGNKERPGCLLQAVPLAFASKALPQLRWPVMSPLQNLVSREERHQVMINVLEWAGAALVGASALVTHELKGSQLAPLFCSYRLAGVSDDVSSESTSLTWTGMLHSSSCAQVLSALRSALAEDGSEWAVFSVCGFPEALVSWGETPHRPSWFGDHRSTMYTLYLNKHSYFGFVTGDDESLPL